MYIFMYMFLYMHILYNCLCFQGSWHNWQAIEIPMNFCPLHFCGLPTSIHSSPSGSMSILCGLLEQPCNYIVTTTVSHRMISPPQHSFMLCSCSPSSSPASGKHWLFYRLHHLFLSVMSFYSFVWVIFLFAVAKYTIKATSGSKDLFWLIFWGVKSTMEK